MKKCCFKPYDGKEPYIFISYAHKDSDKVYPILENMHSRGYRIWYDDGIAPGSEWPENIAQHLNDATVVLAFISERSIASDNCRREITFALSKQKAFLSVMLEKTVLSPGMELQLSAQQCVMGYAYDNREEFVDKICQCPDLACCLRQPVKIPDDPPVVPAPNPKPTIQPSKKFAFSKATLIDVAVGVAVLIVILLLVFLPGKPEEPPTQTTEPTTQSDPSDNQNAGNQEDNNIDPNPGVAVIAPDVEFDVNTTTNVALSDLTIAEATVKQLNKLSKLETLVFENCTFTAPLKLENDSLWKLRFTNCTGNQYLQELDGLTDLYWLQVFGGTLTDQDIPVLNLPKLNEFSLTDNASFTDVSKLVNCTGLSTIIVDNTGVSDLSSLSQISDVAYISANNCPITSIDCLAPLETLRSLSFNGCQIGTVTGQFKSLRIDNLEFHNNPLTDISGFDNLTVLNSVNFGYTALEKMICVEKSVETLQYANFAGCNGEIKNFLKNCVKITDLVVDDVPMDNCDVFAGMADLQTLSAENCKIGSTSGLRNCTKITELNLMNNQISDIRFLSVLSKVRWLTIDLTMNKITDLSQIPSDLRFDGLSVAKNPIDYATFPVTDGFTLILSYNDTFNQDNLPRDLYFSTVYLLDCPDDKKVAIEDYLTSSIHFTTFEELMS